MQSTAIDVFLSCSFRPEDTDIVNLVKSMCRALNVDCINVSQGYAQIPPERAKEYIRGLPGMIAIASRRQPFGEEQYGMPSAVREEVSMAYALGKPILLLREDGVQFDGFMNNYGTHLSFSRDNIWDTEFIERLVGSIQGLKVNMLPTEGITPYPHSPDYYIESYRGLIELEKGEDGFVWDCTITRKIRFIKDFRGSLKVGFRREGPLPTDKGLPNINWHVIYQSGSKKFDLTPSVNKLSPAFLDLSIQFTPPPEENDFIEYTVTFKSRYLFPIYPEEASTTLVIKDKTYSAFAGIMRSARTETLKLQYRFPKDYNLNMRDITSLVATVSSTFEYVVESEIERINTTMDSFGGNIVVDLIATKPLLGCFYGIAWI